MYKISTILDQKTETMSSEHFPRNLTSRILYPDLFYRHVGFHDLIRVDFVLGSNITDIRLLHKSTYV
jgi:hypothetical protein